jgi:23S rRNA pseudouridine2457 synthase
MHQYFLFYKPYQVLSQFTPEGNKATLSNFFKGIAKDVYPVGRLDYDSEGLLLLTNDTRLTHQLLTPSFGHTRTYFVQVEGRMTTDAIAHLERGVTITIDSKPHTTLPAKAVILDPDPQLPPRNPPIRYRVSVPDSWISLTLTEGKNRQVRRMTAATGFPTLRLVRYAIGSVTLKNLAPGSYRELNQKEVLELTRK